MSCLLRYTAPAGAGPGKSAPDYARPVLSVMGGPGRHSPGCKVVGGIPHADDWILLNFFPPALLISSIVVTARVLDRTGDDDAAVILYRLDFFFLFLLLFFFAGAYQDRPHGVWDGQEFCSPKLSTRPPFFCVRSPSF